MKYGIFILSFLFTSMIISAQDLDFMIHGSFGKPISKEQLVNAEKLSDLKSDYPSSWIADSDYISTEVFGICSGKEVSAAGISIDLTPEQKKMLKNTDIGTDIKVVVKYKSTNSITGKEDINTMNFSLSRVPKTEATYSGGEEELKLYLKLQAIDKINQTSSNKFEFAAVKFFIDIEGNPIKPKLITSTGDKEIDKILITTIENMPKWKPAEDAMGNKVVQEFEFNVGSMIGC